MDLYQKRVPTSILVIDKQKVVVIIKQAKKEYNKYKEKFPNRPPNEIDFELGFKEALEWVTKELEVEEPLYMFEARIKKELE